MHKMTVMCDSPSPHTPQLPAFVAEVTASAE